MSGFLLIFFSEIGDKTFFIALLLALKQVRAISKRNIKFVSESRAAVRVGGARGSC